MRSVANRKMLGAMCLFGALTLGVAQANAAPSTADASATWSIQVNWPKMAKSQIGKGLRNFIAAHCPFCSARQKAIKKALGLDPAKDIGAAMLFGNAARPQSATLVVDLKHSTGNLQGWMLTLPGYRSSQLDKHTLLHSFFMRGRHGEHGRHRVWVALPQVGHHHRYEMIASPDRVKVVHLAKEVRRGKNLVKDGKLSGDKALVVTVGNLNGLSLPSDRPGSAVVRSITRMQASISVGKKLRLAVRMTIESAARAEQMVQLMRGGIALVQVSASERPGAGPIADILKGLKIVHKRGAREIRVEMILDQHQVEAAMSSAIQRMKQLHHARHEHEHRER